MLNGEITDVRGAYDYLMSDSPDVWKFLEKCSHEVFMSKYNDENNQIIATLFFSKITKKSQSFIKKVLNELYEREWMGEEVTTAYLYNGLFPSKNN